MAPFGGNGNQTLYLDSSLTVLGYVGLFEPRPPLVPKRQSLSMWLFIGPNDTGPYSCLDPTEDIPFCFGLSVRSNALPSFVLETVEGTAIQPTAAWTYRINSDWIPKAILCIYHALDRLIHSPS
ncbi:hypothetical protein QCA50_006363 [Cerrena zonata]|uniref:Uncharacterized protein n=1 Tax=Cerrena zonata TaxID=2478898 RepID=A0AAW0GIY7_9APHY